MLLEDTVLYEVSGVNIVLLGVSRGDHGYVYFKVAVFLEVDVSIG